MKRLSKMLLGAVIVAVAATSIPVEAGGKKKSSTPNIKCVTAFAKAFPSALQKAIKVADPSSLRVEYHVNSEKLRVSADICFTSNGSGHLRKKKKYVIEVRCGNSSYPKEVHD